VAARRFDNARQILFPLLGVVTLLVLHELTGISKWVLMVPVLLATFLVIWIWDRVATRNEDI